MCIIFNYERYSFKFIFNYQKSVEPKNNYQNQFISTMLHQISLTWLNLISPSCECRGIMRKSGRLISFFSILVRREWPIRSWDRFRRAIKTSNRGSNLGDRKSMFFNFFQPNRIQRQQDRTRVIVATKTKRTTRVTGR